MPGSPPTSGLLKDALPHRAANVNLVLDFAACLPDCRQVKGVRAKVRHLRLTAPGDLAGAVGLFGICCRKRPASALRSSLKLAGKSADIQFMQVRILDSRPGSAAVLIDFPCEAHRITLRELIRLRVTFEVERYHRDRPEVFLGLVQPEPSEEILNGSGSKLRCYREVDPERQVARAVRAFEEQRFVVIAGGRQIESLDEEIDLSAGNVEFLKLAPLMGG